MIEVVTYASEWPGLFARVAADLSVALEGLPESAVEHVGSTSVPGLAAKPILDIDVTVPGRDVPDAVAALATIGYTHRGDLGVASREAMTPPDDRLRRNVSVCAAGTLNVRNHLAVRDVLRRRDDLREEYATVKRRLASDPEMDMATYLAGKSVVLQKVLALFDLSEDECHRIWRLNAPVVTLP